MKNLTGRSQPEAAKPEDGTAASAVIRSFLPLNRYWPAADMLLEPDSQSLCGNGYTRPGKPTDSGLIGSFNGQLRDEFLNINEFVTLHDAR